MAAKEEEKKAPSNSDKKIIFVTGANKGIGFELCKQLVQEKDVFVIVGCRNFSYVLKPKKENDRYYADNYEYSNDDNQKGLTRIEILKNIKFKGIDNVDFVEIDITNQKSIDNAVKQIKDKYKQIHILVNNAGMAFKGNAFDINVVNTTLKTNYYGTVGLTDAMLPFIKNGGRIIMTSGRAGLIKSVYKDINVGKQLLDNKLQMSDLEKVIETFRSDVSKDKSLKKSIFKKTANGMSKCAVSTYSRILNQELLDKKRNVFVASYCPGYCVTFMTSGGGNRSASNGAKGLQLLCVNNSFDFKKHSGMFWGVEFADDKKDNDNAKLANYDWV